MEIKKFNFLKKIFLYVRLSRTYMLYNEIVERGCGL